MVGIPRGLFYHEFYPLWKSFFEEMGVEFMVSDQTNKKILEDGLRYCVEGACLPVKLFHGHVLNLKDRVDYLFIPRFTSISKNEYICPKFGGLPDMVRHTFEGLPPIIDTEVNLRKSSKGGLVSALEIGHYFTDHEKKIRKAYKNALYQYKEHKKSRLEGFVSKDENYSEKRQEYALRIAVLGHVYNLYDPFMNMDLLMKLKRKSIDILTIDQMDEEILYEKSKLLPKKIFWNFGSKAMGSAFHILEREDIDGVIYVMSFGCGIDSFISDLFEKKIREAKDLPFIILMMDEHSGDAGMATRIEAFVDMIRWRKKNEAHFSTHG